MRAPVPAPVSYTHLDVYKRQIYDKLASGKINSGKGTVFHSAPAFTLQSILPHEAGSQKLSLIHIYGSYVYSGDVLRLGESEQAFSFGFYLSAR